MYCHCGIEIDGVLFGRTGDIGHFDWGLNAMFTKVPALSGPKSKIRREKAEKLNFKCECISHDNRLVSPDTVY